MAKKITINLHVKVPPAEVFRAFSNATALREWLCDVATVIPREGGRVYLWWEHGSFITGRFTKFVPNEELEIRCQGCDESTPTKISLTFAEKDGGTELELKESGFGNNHKGKKLKQKVQRRWECSLENLVNVLEKGPDLRVVERPMLGIFTENLDEKKAAKIGVPVSQGVLVTGLAEGMNAVSSGVQKNDVIIKMDGKPVMDFSSLRAALRSHKAGDSIETQLYRRGSLKTFWITLSCRPVPEIPKTAKELSETLAKIYVEKFSELKKCFEGISEEIANAAPKKGEWGANGNLAHLIYAERDLQVWMQTTILDQELVADDFGGNLDAHILAIIKVFASHKALLEEYQRSLKETVFLVEGLPAEFVRRKGSYWKMAFYLLTYYPHIDEHIAQIKAALETAKKKEARK